MLASIRGPESSITVDIPASVQWVISDTRRHGEAKVTIPRDSSAWVEEVINDEGGFFFEIYTSGRIWRGIADVPVYSEAGAEITVRSISHWLNIRHVGYQTYYGVTAGTIAKAALRQGVTTAVPLTIGTILEAPPIIAEYEFRGQSVLNIFTDLSELTGQTWTINDDYQVNWIPRQGKHHELWLIDDGRLLDNIQTGSLGDTYSEIIEIDDVGRRFSAFKWSPALWPQQQEINIGR